MQRHRVSYLQLRDEKCGEFVLQLQVESGEGCNLHVIARPQPWAERDSNQTFKVQGKGSGLLYPTIRVLGSAQNVAFRLRLWVCQTGTVFTSHRNRHVTN